VTPADPLLSIVWLAVIILGRDVALAISAIYYRWISLPPPKTFSRYWDFSLPSAEVKPTTISKYNTALQLALMGLTTAAPVVTAIDLATPLGVMQYVCPRCAVPRSYLDQSIPARTQRISLFGSKC